VTSVELAAWFDAGRTITIIGTRAGLDSLASPLRAGHGGAVEVATEPPAEPFSGAAASIQILATDEAGVAVERRGDDVCIVGDRAGLGILGDNLHRLAVDPESLGGHIHIEPFPGHPYLRPGSAPLVVEAR
jgi:hypothetical protein